MAAQPLGATAPTVFNFTSHSLRVVMRNGDPWFAAADVCDALIDPAKFIRDSCCIFYVRVLEEFFHPLG